MLGGEAGVRHCSIGMREKCLGTWGRNFSAESSFAIIGPTESRNPAAFRRALAAATALDLLFSLCPTSLLSLRQPQEEQAQLSTALPLALGSIGTPCPYPCSLVAGVGHPLILRKAEVTFACLAAGWLQPLPP